MRRTATELTADLTCKEIVEIVTDYLEGRLGVAEERRLDEHLAECDGCTTYIAQMRRTIDLVGDLREEHVSPVVYERLAGVFRAWQQA